MGAPAGRVAGLARLWARAGHKVHVLTGFPHHPTGRIHPEYRKRFLRGFVREEHGGATVHRTWIFPAANKGKVLRSANYLSFMTSAALSGSLAVPQPDVVVATSPQLLCAGAGALLARRWRAPFVMEVRDLWPESLVAVGASAQQAPLVRALESLARRLYASADHVVTVTEAQRAAIVAGGIPGEQVTVIPNGVDEEFLRRIPEAQPDAANGEFIVTYIGTLGMAHRLETLLETAQRLRGELAFRFRIVGEGARRQALEEKARAMNLANVEFVGERPREEVPRWIAESSACLVVLRKTDVFTTVVPSKMLEIMAVGRPIVLGVRGEASRLLEQAGAGIAVEPENAGELAAALHALRADPQRCRRLGENGRDFVRREFLRESLADRYLRLLAQLVQPAAALAAKPQPASESQ
jgi:glycosyltransferase involved in cell wall biosynthesis